VRKPNVLAAARLNVTSLATPGNSGTPLARKLGVKAGGRMLMITLKRFFGDRMSLRAEQMTYMVGFVFLFAFLIWVTGYDIVRSYKRQPSDCDALN